MRCKYNDVVVCPYGNVCKTHVPQTRTAKHEMHYPEKKPFFTCAGLTNVKEITSCGNMNKEHSRFIHPTMHNNFTVTCMFTISWVSESVCFFLEMSVSQVTDKYQHHKAFHLSVENKLSEVYSNTAY